MKNLLSIQICSRICSAKCVKSLLRFLISNIMHGKTPGNVCRHTVKVGSFTEFPASQGLLRAGDFRGCPQVWQGRARQPWTSSAPQPGSRAACAAPDTDIRHLPGLTCPSGTIRRSLQEQRGLWVLPSSFLFFHSFLNGRANPWLLLPRLGITEGKPSVRKPCRKPFGWEKVGWKASLSGFFYQVLLSQPLHAAESLRSSSSQLDCKSFLRTRDRRRDFTELLFAELSWGEGGVDI